MKKLTALCCLWAFGLSDKDDYAAELDRLFLESPEDDFLLELENLGGDYKAAWARIEPLIGSDVSTDGFGKELFAALEKIYGENRFPLAEFGRICSALWRFLPGELDMKEPFFRLSTRTSRSLGATKSKRANYIKPRSIIMRSQK